METIINAIRYFIHENSDEVARAEERFVSATSSLYTTLMFSLVAIVCMFAIHMAVNIEFNAYKKIGLLFMSISLFAIILNLFYARHIFKMALAGGVYGVARSNVSGIDGTKEFLSQYFAAGFKIMAGIVVLFGVPSTIDFTWTSASIVACVCLFIGFNAFSEKIGG